MHTKGLVNGWYIILGLDMKGEIKVKELIDEPIADIKKKVDGLNVLHNGLTHFVYEIKQAELAL